MLVLFFLKQNIGLVNHYMATAALPAPARVRAQGLNF